MNKKIIFILITVLFIIVLVSVIIGRNKSRPIGTSQSPSISPVNEVMPGILIPTTEVRPGELDVIAVTPADMSTEIIKTAPITIIFSQPVTEKEIQFMINPEIPFTQKIEGNTLIITPTEEFETKTLYTYRIKIRNDNQKIRIYTFATAGEGMLFTPDTAPSEENIKIYEESVRIRYPDIYLYNKTPYETEKFAVTSIFSQEKNHNIFTVFLKGANKNYSRAAFIIWLQSLDLTDKQIESLDITYE